MGVVCTETGLGAVASVGMATLAAGGAPRAVYPHYVRAATHGFVTDGGALPARGIAPRRALIPRSDLLPCKRPKHRYRAVVKFADRLLSAESLTHDEAIAALIRLLDPAIEAVRDEAGLRIG